MYIAINARERVPQGLCSCVFLCLMGLMLAKVGRKWWGGSFRSVHTVYGDLVIDGVRAG